jgi:hypothetical protein
MELKKAVENINELVMHDGQYGKSWHDNKKKVHSIDATTAFIYDANFLVVAHKERIYVYHEDDGMFIYKENDGFDFNSAFTYSLISLLSEIQHYITMVGIPYHYKPECVTRCGFALGVEVDKEKY